jgi:hypothetical protein
MCIGEKEICKVENKILKRNWTEIWRR